MAETNGFQKPRFACKKACQPFGLLSDFRDDKPINLPCSVAAGEFVFHLFFSVWLPDPHKSVLMGMSQMIALL